MRIAGIYSAILIACCATSCAAKPKEARCEPLGNWHRANFSIPELRQYIPVSVRGKSYLILRKSIMKESDFRNYLVSVSLRSYKQRDLTPYIYLTSNRELSCDQFVKAAEIVNDVYDCQGTGACIWGYGMGEQAHPADIPAQVSGHP